MFADWFQTHGWGNLNGVLTVSVLPDQFVLLGEQVQATQQSEDWDPLTHNKTNQKLLQQYLIKEKLH